MLVIETPANPSMEISDITALAGATRGLTVADNTFATPLATRPLDLGVDIVVHSASKYLAGHSDSLLGIAVSRDSGLTAALHSQRALHGATPGVLEAFLATRGVRTMPLRVRAASANAMTVAERLAARADIAEVRYPGLPGDPGHAVAPHPDEQLRVGGGVPPRAGGHAPTRSCARPGCGPTPPAWAGSSPP